MLITPSTKNALRVKEMLEKSRARAERDLATLQKDIHRNLQHVEELFAEHPGRLALFSAGIGAVVGAALVQLSRYRRR